jgi:hypothetical protein
MDVYITREGTKLTAEFPQELLEKLSQAEPDCDILFEQFKTKSNSPQESKNVNSENVIAQLIQNDYLSVVDPIDG